MALCGQRKLPLPVTHSRTQLESTLRSAVTAMIALHKHRQLWKTNKPSMRTEALAHTDALYLTILNSQYASGNFRNRIAFVRPVISAK